MAQDGPRRIGAVPPSDPRVNQVVSALGKPWPEGKVLKIVDGKPQWADEAGGGSSGSGVLAEAAVTFSGYINVINDPNHYQVILPFDRTVVSVGDTPFTIDTAHSVGGFTGTAIVVPVDGVYQFGFAGEFDVMPPGTDDQWIQLDVLAHSSAHYAIASQVRVPGSPRVQWPVSVCSNVLLLSAGDPIYTALTESGFFGYKVYAYGSPDDATNIGWNATMWARQLA